MRNNKGATAFSVLLLVMMTLVLSSFALFSFMTSDAVSQEIKNVRAIEEVYTKESEIKFFIKNTGDLKNVQERFEDKNTEIKIDKKEEEITINREIQDQNVIYTFSIDSPYYRFEEESIEGIDGKTLICYYGDKKLNIFLHSGKVKVLLNGEKKEVGIYKQIDNEIFISLIDTESLGKKVSLETMNHLKKIEAIHYKSGGCPLTYPANIGKVSNKNILMSFGNEDKESPFYLNYDKIYLDCRFSQRDIEVGSIDNEVDINEKFFNLDSEIMQRIRFKCYFDIEEVAEYLALLDSSEFISNNDVFCKNSREKSLIIPDWPENEGKSINLEVKDLNLRSENGEVRIDFSGIKFVQGSNIDYLYLEKLKDDDFLPKEMILAKSDNDDSILAFYPDDSVWLANERYYNLHGFMKSGWKDLEKENRNYFFSKFRSESNVIVDYDKLSELFDRLS